jgi:hypothetical protein
MDFGASPLALKVEQSDVIYECASSDGSNCQYTQDEADESFPIFTLVELSGTTDIIFTGLNFYDVGYTATAFY